MIEDDFIGQNYVMFKVIEKGAKEQKKHNNCFATETISRKLITNGNVVQMFLF